ncbi:alpha/beta fold hydrolase [Modestobacter sp. CPCC 205119]|uniref:Alpha/beta fold hydrolase n=2 Tax=Goekera deserti TaxID=2497753 RepID=A0A7K3WAD2_9ACTN|nr:alpha/beta fold hydrolase [Goekera deserti]
MWDPQVPVLAEHLQVVRYDTRGHGRSPVGDGPGTGGATVDDLVDDVVALLDRLNLGRVHVAGLSIGGMTALRLAAREPERVDRLAVLCSSAYPGNREGWLERAATVRSAGTGSLAETVVGRWLTPAYAAAHPELVDRLRAMVAGTSDEGYAACCAAIADLDLRPDLPRITAPTLVVSGADDPALPPEHQEAIAGPIPGAELLTLSPAAHLANLEQDRRVSDALLAHFTGGPR